jgi:hypothetical protein
MACRRSRWLRSEHNYIFEQTDSRTGNSGGQRRERKLISGPAAFECVEGIGDYA